MSSVLFTAIQTKRHEKEYAAGWLQNVSDNTERHETVSQDNSSLQGGE